MTAPASDAYNVRARCPGCNGSTSTFEFKSGGSELGYVLLNTHHRFNGKDYGRHHFRLLRCAACGRAGFAHFHDNGNTESAVLGDFYPHLPEYAALPPSVPKGIGAELREAELCASVGAWRAGSAMVRSVLDKALKDSGYTSGGLYEKIETATTDGVLTAARRERAQKHIRVLGNDVLHEDWREVPADEFSAAHHYAQRILEDLYDDRPTVEALLRTKGRLK